MAKKAYQHYTVTAPADKITRKKKRPKLMAVVDEDNCTGCQVCIPFCPVDCIEPVPAEKYGIPIPPVHVRYDECIGCQLCARACTELTWDAIVMMPTDDFEQKFSKKEVLADTEEFKLTGNHTTLSGLIVQSGMAQSKNEAMRLIRQGGVAMDGQKILNDKALELDKSFILKVGKRRIKKILPVSENNA